MPKFMDPMFSEHISGFTRRAAASRSSIVIVSPPPVVMLRTASHCCLRQVRNCKYTSGSRVGLPSIGSRACKCTMGAPALAAASACAEIWAGVMGRASDIVGVWMLPVMAQEMMTLLLVLAFILFLQSGHVLTESCGPPKLTRLSSCPHACLSYAKLVPNR